MGFFCRCCRRFSSGSPPPPPVCDPPTCPDGTPRLPPDCACCEKTVCWNGQPPTPWPDCQCPEAPAEIVICGACCAAGQTNCTPRMFLVSIPDAAHNPNSLCPPCGPAGDQDCCQPPFEVGVRQSRGCANGGSYYLICNRPLYFQWRHEPSRECEHAATFTETLTLPTGPITCCEWSFCKPSVSFDFPLVDPGGNLCPPRPCCEPGFFCHDPAGGNPKACRADLYPDCYLLGRTSYNHWCYASSIVLAAVEEATTAFFQLEIGIYNTLRGYPCMANSGRFDYAPAGIYVTGRSASVPKPLNCFGAHLIALTHWKAYGDSGGQPLPITAANSSLTTPPACLFPAGLSATIQGIP